MTYQQEELFYSLQELFHSYFNELYENIVEIKPGASDRRIYRLISNSHSAIAVQNKNVKENTAFIEFTKSFLKCGLNVPDIFLVSKNKEMYLERDLGDTSLFTYANYNDDYLEYYKTSLSDLIKFQVQGKDCINYKFCCETKEFDIAQIKYDLNKFNIYYAQKFLEVKLILDTLVTIFGKQLLNADRYFMYRDFQPRNIMVYDNSLYYIDYQSGRLGPLQYDLASFLFSSSIKLNEHQRIELKEYYVKLLSDRIKLNREEFDNVFKYAALIRLLQMLGNYGYLNYIRKDEMILGKIPQAKKSINSLKEKFQEKEIQQLIESILE